MFIQEVRNRTERRLPGTGKVVTSLPVISMRKSLVWLLPTESTGVPTVCGWRTTCSDTSSTDTVLMCRNFKGFPRSITVFRNDRSV